MSLEDKITSAIEGKEESEKDDAILTALKEFAEENKAEQKVKEFVEARELARKENCAEIDAIVQSMKEAFNAKWQAFEDNDMTIVKDEEVVVEKE